MARHFTKHSDDAELSREVLRASCPAATPGQVGRALGSVSPARWRGRLLGGLRPIEIYLMTDEDLLARRGVGMVSLCILRMAYGCFHGQGWVDRVTSPLGETLQAAALFYGQRVRRSPGRPAKVRGGEARMPVVSTLQPGVRGTLREVEEHGGRLVAVRYRRRGGGHVKTVELIAGGAV